MNRPNLPLTLTSLAAVAVFALLAVPELPRIWAQYRIDAAGLGSGDANLSPASEDRVRGAQIVDALCAGRMDDARLFLRAGYPVKARSYEHALSALHCAALWGDAEMIRTLVERGAEVTSRAGELELEPIHLAAASGNIEAVEALVALGATIDAPSPAGTPVLVAFTPRLSELLPSALRRDLKDLGFPGAQRARDVALLERFVALGARLDGANRDGETLLHLAVERGDVALVENLMARGLDPNAADSNGKTPLVLASRLAAGPGVAVKEALVRTLVAGGADANARDRAGANAFCGALDEPEVLAVLVERGIDTRASGADATQCWYALRRSMTPQEIMRLADRIPNLETPTRPDGTPGAGPLHAYAMSNDADLVRYFLARGLEPIDRAAGGYGVLHAALGSTGGVGDHEAAREEIVRMLLDAGADLEARTDRGLTPLMVAGQQPASLIRLLIERGANVNAINPNNGMTALDLFERSRYRNDEAIAVLRAAGAINGR